MKKWFATCKQNCTVLIFLITMAQREDTNLEDCWECFDTDIYIQRCTPFKEEIQQTKGVN